MFKEFEMKKVLLMLIIMPIFLQVSTCYAEDIEKQSITIVYTGNTDGYLKSCNCPDNPFGGLAKRATCLKKLRKEKSNLVVVDSGDFFPKDPYELQAKYCLKIMKLLKYDAIMIGDQEFILGSDFIKQHIEKAGLPFIATNMSLCVNNSCIRLACPFVIKQVGKYRVGIIGVIGDNAFAFFPKDKIEKLDIYDPMNALKTSIAMLKKEEQVDLIVVLSHMGYKMDQEMAKQVKGIAVIVGGHSHELLRTPVQIGKTIILHPGEKGQYVGVFSINMITMEMDNKMIPLVKDIPDDSQIKGIIDQYTKSVKKKTKRLEF
ncbi:MAG: metallophosphatase [Candidatus Desantisbacteria bacterium]